MVEVVSQNAIPRSEREDTRRLQTKPVLLRKSGILFFGTRYSI